jgi:hypothetical protein
MYNFHQNLILLNHQYSLSLISTFSPLMFEFSSLHIRKILTQKNSKWKNRTQEPGCFIKSIHDFFNFFESMACIIRGWPSHLNFLKVWCFFFWLFLEDFCDEGEFRSCFCGNYKLSPQRDDVFLCSKSIYSQLCTCDRWLCQVLWHVRTVFGTILSLHPLLFLCCPTIWSTVGTPGAPRFAFRIPLHKGLGGVQNILNKNSKEPEIYANFEGLWMLCKPINVH